VIDLDASASGAILHAACGNYRLAVHMLIRLHLGLWLMAVRLNVDVHGDSLQSG